MFQMLKIVKNFYKICFNKSVPYSDYLSFLRTGHPLGKQISKRSQVLSNECEA